MVCDPTSESSEVWWKSKGKWSFMKVDLIMYHFQYRGKVKWDRTWFKPGYKEEGEKRRDRRLEDISIYRVYLLNSEFGINFYWTAF